MMLPIIAEAAMNFCHHQIRLPYQLLPNPSQKRTLLAYIDIETNGGEMHRAFVGCDPLLLQTITGIFLGEEESDEQTLADMLLETTNMIIGSAKVLAAESYDMSMSIATPFLTADDLPAIAVDAIQSIGIDEGEMTVALKRL